MCSIHARRACGQRAGLSFVGSCACTNQSRHFVRRSTENIRAFKSLTAGFMEKSIGSKKRLVVSWTDLQIVQLLCRQMKYKSHRIAPSRDTGRRMVEIAGLSNADAQPDTAFATFGSSSSPRHRLQTGENHCAEHGRS